MLSNVGSVSLGVKRELFGGLVGPAFTYGAQNWC